MNSSTSYPSVTDRAYTTSLIAASATVALTLILIIGFLLLESLPILGWKSSLTFDTKVGWYPTEGLFGLTPMLLGSLYVAAGALVLSLPVSLLCAIFMRAYAPYGVQIFMRRLLEVLAGIPSVIFGLWGLVELVPILLKVSAPGTSLMAAAIVLSLMIIPTMTLIVERSFRSFPENIFKSAVATGMETDRIVWRLIVPASFNGVVAGAVLGFGRAIGETMAVLMVAGNVVQLPSSIFDSVRTLTANIALEMSYAMDEHRASLFTCGLILCAIVLLSISLIKSEKVQF